VRGFEILEPNSTEEACRLLSKYGEEAKVFAGGTALVKLMKKRLVHPSYLVNIKGIQELHFIREDREGLKIGALATLRELETSPLVRERFKTIAEMVHTIGSVQIRNVGTLAGNLCFADPASDPAPFMIALGANLKIVSSKGVRVLPSEGFFTDFYETALCRDEILDSKIVLGGVASTPVRTSKAEELLKGKVVSNSLIKEVALAASSEVAPIHDVRASAEYRREMIEVLVDCGIQKAIKRVKGGVL
jgi:carbon-monoxide dehydrogenase medium subunit